MNQLIYLQETLQKKYQLLCRFEEATQEMLSCPAEELEELVARRQELLDQIDRLSRELDSRFQGDETYQVLTDVLQGRLDMQATLRIRTEQEIILKQIKAVNQGHSAKAARFFSGPGGGSSSRLGNA